MLRNYLTTAFRALKRNWSYSLINVVGLTFGLACCLLLFLVIRYELSYDRHHASADQLYRIVTHVKTSEGEGYNSGMPLPALAALRTDFPEMQQDLTMISDLRETLVATNAPQAPGGLRRFEEPRGTMAFVEPEYFRLFSYQWVQGNPATALVNPNTVVLTETMAEKYFGTASPIGKIIRVRNKMDFVVTGLVKTPPVTTDLPFGILLSFASLKEFGANTGWDDWQSNSSGVQIYLKVSRDPAQLERQLVAFTKKYLPAEDAQRQRYELQPLSDLHFNPEISTYSDRTVSRRMIWAMGLIGLFLLITACINFVNLATAQAIRRAKEVGVRKVLGSSRMQLVRQFLGETGFLTGISIVLALVIAYFSVPFLADLLKIQLTFSLFANQEVVGFLLLLGMVTTVLAGFYPALVLSGYQPVQALKSKVRVVGSGHLTLRRSLIVLQFTISQMLIIGTIVAYNQMEYFRSADIGFRKDAILTVPIPEKKPGQLEVFRNQLAAIPGVESVSYGMSAPSANGNWWTSFQFENAEKPSDFGVVMRPADTAYISTYGMKLLAGRNFQPADTMREAIINETLLHKVGLNDPQQAIGRLISVGGNPKMPIVGVVRDFNTFSLHRKTDPCVLATHRNAYNLAGIKFAGQGGTAGISQLMASVEKTWMATFPDFLFKYEFLDQTLANFYQGEERMYSIFRLLAGIAIFIGCLGLYGVVALMAESRTKEVGIRKVLGATTAHIFSLFSVDFLKLVLMALVLASPIAYYVMDKWLADFDYKISIEWWMFALTGLLATGIALLTVSFQSVKAALMNPVTSLRSE
ncbi:ABC transporter permease [Nibrella viscosa]|uniref:ABC transporter permease n=1 Tax=Nibrella viscosa TaxID=1084524 RepID=A0ABP8KMQ6_9BACT